MFHDCEEICEGVFLLVLDYLKFRGFFFPYCFLINKKSLKAYQRKTFRHIFLVPCFTGIELAKLF